MMIMEMRSKKPLLLVAAVVVIYLCVLHTFSRLDRTPLYNQAPLAFRAPEAAVVGDDETCIPDYMAKSALTDYVASGRLEKELGVPVDAFHQFIKMSNDSKIRFDSGFERFLPHYKSPCWLEPLPNTTELYSTNKYRESHVRALGRRFDSLRATFQSLHEQGVRTRIRCLPLVYIVGVMKGGTSDLRTSLNMHPDLSEAGPIHYLKFGHKPMLEDYIDTYDGVGIKMGRTFGRACSTGREFHPGVVFEQEPGLIFSFNEQFENLPWNKQDKTKPSFHMFHGLRFLVPQAKLLLILRRPEDRLYSSYKQYTPLHIQSAENFHKAVTKEISLFQKCLNISNFEYCFYPNRFQRLRNAHDPRRSLYYGFVFDLLKIFPRHQVHIFKAETFYSDRVSEMRRIVDFLGVSKMDLKLERSLLVKPAFNIAANRYARANLTEPKAMLAETRQMLKEFYRPWNNKLAELLQDNTFTWT